MKKLGFVFSGQGSQYVGMGKQLYDNYVVARETFEECEDVLGYKMTKLCFEGDLDKLTMTSNAQPAILTVSIAAYRALKEEVSLNPSFLAGHSLGEYVALVCADAVSFQDALKLVHKRGELMEAAMDDGAMIAVMNLPVEQVEEICRQVSNEDEFAVIANYNSYEQLSVAGNISAINRAEEAFRKKNAKFVKLKVSSAFHTKAMLSAALAFHETLKDISFHHLSIPVISNVTGLPYRSADGIVENLTKQIFHPVKWCSSVEYMKNQGIHNYLEFGPKKVLGRLIEQIDKNCKVYQVGNKDDILKVKEAGLEEKPDYMEFMIGCIGLAVSTPNRNWNNMEYENGVVKPYRTISDLQLKLEKSNQIPSLSQVKEAYHMIQSVLKTKMVPEAECTQLLEELMEVTNMKEELHKEC